MKKQTYDSKPSHQTNLLANFGSLNHTDNTLELERQNYLKLNYFLMPFYIRSKKRKRKYIKMTNLKSKELLNLNLKKNY
jgi:hypothetical protein